MSDIVRQSKALMESRAQRSASRELARINQSRDLIVAHHVAELDIAQTVTEAAMIAVAQVGAMEATLAERVPHAEPRLRHIADAHAIAAGNVVSRMAR